LKGPLYYNTRKHWAFTVSIGALFYLLQKQVDFLQLMMDNYNETGFTESTEEGTKKERKGKQTELLFNKIELD